MTTPAFDGPPVFAFAAGEREALGQALEVHASALSRLVVAIDGPSGSGKSSTARAVASRLGLLFVDTGAMYRALTLAALRAGLAPENGRALEKLAGSHRIDLEPHGDTVRVRLDDEDVSAAVRSPEVTTAVSRVAAHPAVRRDMVRRQRALGARRGVVAEGRDIGTVVFPDADLKVFVVADARTRALRRQQEDAARGVERSVETIEAELRQRDAHDSERQASPLRRAPDAMLLDTSGLAFETQVDAVLALAVRVVRGRQGGEAAGVRLEPVDGPEWNQASYRRFPSPLYWIVWGLLRLGLRGFWGLRIHMHPVAWLPGSALFACNHVAGADPVVAGSAISVETWYVAKLELFRNPFLARLIARFNAIPIRRGTADYAALDRAVELLERSRNVLMFPEGTRQKPGKLGKPRWGFGYVARKSGRPIVPVFVRGTRDGRPRLLRRQPLEVWIGEPVRVRVTSDTLDDNALHKTIGNLVMERIAGLMLRSAAAHPLPGLELPGHFASIGIERTETSART